MKKLSIEKINKLLNSDEVDEQMKRDLREKKKKLLNQDTVQKDGNN